VPRTNIAYTSLLEKRNDWITDSPRSYQSMSGVIFYGDFDSKSSSLTKLEGVEEQFDIDAASSSDSMTAAPAEKGRGSSRKVWRPKSATTGREEALC
jgi:hypothetical protein